MTVVSVDQVGKGSGSERKFKKIKKKKKSNRERERERASRNRSRSRSKGNKVMTRQHRRIEKPKKKLSRSCWLIKKDDRNRGVN